MVAQGALGHFAYLGPCFLVGLASASLEMWIEVRSFSCRRRERGCDEEKRNGMRIDAILIALCAWGCCLTATALDLGVVDSHRKVECGFAITNTSDKVWKVIGARSSCACMSVSVQQGEMKPGEVRSVAVTFDPAGMEGPVEKVVQVDLKPGKSVTQTYKANVRRRLGLDPQDAAFGVIRSRETDRRMSVKLCGDAAQAVRITSLCPPENPVFELKLAQDGKGLDVGFAPGNWLPGTYSEQWIVKTTDNEIPELKFLISARVADGFSVTPQVLTIGWNDPVCSRMVLLRPERKTRPFKVLSAETKPRKWGEVKIAPRPLNGWQISIDGIDPAVVRQFSKRPYLEIVTDLSESSIISVPLQVVK